MYLPSDFAVNELWSAQSTDVVIDASGLSNGFNNSLKNAKSCGRIIVKTTTYESSDVLLSDIVVREINGLESRCCLFQPTPPALENRNVKVDDLITHRF